MEKQILLEQLNDRIQRGLGLITLLYPAILKHSVDEKEDKNIIYLLESVKCLMKVVIDVEYYGNIDSYRDEIYKIAKLQGRDLE